MYSEEGLLVVKPDEPDRKWICHPSTSDFDEIIDFVGGLANTIPIEIIRRDSPSTAIT